MFKHLDSLQTDQVKDTMFLVEHEPNDVVIREGTLQFSAKLLIWNKSRVSVNIEKDTPAYGQI